MFFTVSAHADIVITWTLGKNDIKSHYKYGI